MARFIDGVDGGHWPFDSRSRPGRGHPHGMKSNRVSKSPRLVQVPLFGVALITLLGLEGYFGSMILSAIEHSSAVMMEAVMLSNAFPGGFGFHGY